MSRLHAGLAGVLACRANQKTLYKPFEVKAEAAKHICLAGHQSANADTAVHRTAATLFLHGIKKYPVGITAISRGLSVSDIPGTEEIGS